VPGRRKKSRADEEAKKSTDIHGKRRPTSQDRGAEKGGYQRKESANKSPSNPNPKRPERENHRHYSEETPSNHTSKLAKKNEGRLLK